MTLKIINFLEMLLTKTKKQALAQTFTIILPNLIHKPIHKPKSHEIQ